MGDGASSVQGLALRVGRLNSDGTPEIGACTGYVTSKFMMFSIEPEYEDGEEISEPAADGTLCTYFQARNQLKRVNVKVSICGPEPELYEILGGGDVLYDTPDGPYTITNAARASNVATITLSANPVGVEIGDTIIVDAGTAGFDTGPGGATVISVSHTGPFTVTYANTGSDAGPAAETGTLQEAPKALGWQSPAAATCGYNPANPDGLSLEAWTRAIVCGAPAAVNPFWKFVVPRAYLDFTGERVIENGAMAHEFEGWGFGNALWAPGPGCDWDFTSDRPYAHVRTSDAPIGQEGCLAIAACP
jgi:hypothetical protein